MIDADVAIRCARDAGLTLFAGVPCSYLTPFINAVISSADLRYISVANEGDAVALVAGSYLGGRPGAAMMQNSGLGNAVSPLSSLTHVFHIPLLLIVTLRGDPACHDEPQHELMGRITESLLATLEIPHQRFPSEASEAASAFDLAVRQMTTRQRPAAMVMRKGAVAPHLLEEQNQPIAPHAVNRQPRWLSSGASKRVSRTEALRRIIEHTDGDSDVVIATTGYTGRELYALADRDNHFYMVGSMGCASSLGLGLAMARPDLRVTVVDGDGAALMRLGNFATIGAYQPPNFTHLLLDNEAHDSTGSQATVSGAMSFAGVAEACRYPLVVEGDDAGLIDDLYDAQDIAGPRFGHLKIRTGAPADLPRPTITPPQVRDRLMRRIGAVSPLTCSSPAQEQKACASAGAAGTA